MMNKELEVAIRIALPRDLIAAAYLGVAARSVHSRRGIVEAGWPSVCPKRTQRLD